VWVALAVLAGQLSVGWSNDYLDRDRDRHAGRTDKPIVVGAVSARAVGIGALVTAGACVPLSFASGWRAALVHLGAVATAWAYNARLKDSALSPLPYTLAFGALPIFVTLGLPRHPMPLGWGIAAAALLGTGAHFVNTLPDFDDDARTGVRGLPHRLGPHVSIAIAAVLMATAAAMAGLAAPGAPDDGAVALLVLAFATIGAVVVAASLDRARLAWRLTLGAAFVTVALFLVQGESLVTPGGFQSLPATGRDTCQELLGGHPRANGKAVASPGCAHLGPWSWQRRCWR
jgi:4-hydroxybenzoate polyprenyltransferase